MPAVLMVKGSGVERLLPCLRRCNTIIHRKQGRRKKGLKRTTKNLEIVRLTFTYLYICNIPVHEKHRKTVHKNMPPHLRCNIDIWRKQNWRRKVTEYQTYFLCLVQDEIQVASENTTYLKSSPKTYSDGDNHYWSSQSFA